MLHWNTQTNRSQTNRYHKHTMSQTDRCHKQTDICPNTTFCDAALKYTSKTDITNKQMSPTNRYQIQSPLKIMLFSSLTKGLVCMWHTTFCSHVELYWTKLCLASFTHFLPKFNIYVMIETGCAIQQYTTAVTSVKVQLVTYCTVQCVQWNWL